MEEAGNYPGKAMLLAIQKHHHIRRLIPKDEPSKMMIRKYTKKEDRYENVCSLTTSYRRPKYAKNTRGQSRFIVNIRKGEGESEEEYVQVVRVGVCATAGAECALGQETRCQQQFLEHKLVALSESGKELVIDTFSFPSCCTCVWRKSSQIEFIK